jgi:hypothetical protein
MSSAGWIATWVLLIESHIHLAYALCSKNTVIKTAMALNITGSKLALHFVINMKVYPRYHSQLGLIETYLRKH